MTAPTSVDTTTHTGDRREHTRFDIQLPAMIRMKDGRCYQGKTNNISNSGAFFHFSGDTDASKESHCILTLLLADEPTPEELKIKCVLKTSQHHGAGLEFKTIATEDYIKFVLLLSKNYPQPEQLLTELQNNPGMQLLGEI
ncbi:MAG: PilZ domain-containing protein [Gammaproteobacteria bacterium]|jgi:hypothetical protein